MKRSFRKIDPEKLKLYFAEHPDAYLREAAIEFNCCETANNLCVQKIKNYAKKKTTRYKEQDSEKVAEYEAKIKEIPQNKRVYVDEASFGSYLLRDYARAPRGQKIYEKIQGLKYQRTSIVAAQRGKKIIAPLEYKGTMYGDFFEAWFENICFLNYQEET